MCNSFPQTCLATATICLLPTWLNAAPISPEIGSQSTLSTIAHNVSGTATIVDENTIRFDDFTYDGGASFVYFYLGTMDTDAAFASGLRISSLLSGTVYDGTQGPVVVNLPSGETVDGYHAVSVWCERFEANFGSGTFQPVPEPAGLALLAVAALGIFACRQH